MLRLPQGARASCPPQGVPGNFRCVKDPAAGTQKQAGGCLPLMSGSGKRNREKDGKTLERKTHQMRLASSGYHLRAAPQEGSPGTCGQEARDALGAGRGMKAPAGGRGECLVLPGVGEAGGPGGGGGRRIRSQGCLCRPVLAS
ncbi:hypothetical protein NDU88_005801 [Pleurodeles waltl]|uniref:Uncharacterized protein n=1 Tax=Pleurodeles waltl TaxID=8319 RepID=A0AAV7L5J7_PLEWA|nr:hypothetical protein NDU88_005801 [Pleurodeles waltl]